MLLSNAQALSQKKQIRPYFSGIPIQTLSKIAKNGMKLIVNLQYLKRYLLCRIALKVNNYRQ